MATEPLAYVDSSALAKLIVEEPETQALRRHLHRRRLTTSDLAIVEIARVAKLAQSRQKTGATAEGVLAEADLVSLSRSMLERAAALTSERVRSLDAIHLATALAVEPDELVAYDQHLLDAATEAGLTTASPR